MSDIILPGTTPFEEDDLTTGGSAWTASCAASRPPSSLCSRPSRSYEICTLIAEKLGIAEEFTEGKSQLDWVQWCYEQGKEAGDDFPDTFEEFRSTGLFKQTDEHEPAIAAPEELATPSGKYEVFSKQAYNISSSGTSPAAVTCPTTGATR